MTWLERIAARVLGPRHLRGHIPHEAGMGGGAAPVTKPSAPSAAPRSRPVVRDDMYPTFLKALREYAESAEVASGCRVEVEGEWDIQRRCYVVRCYGWAGQLLDMREWTREQLARHGSEPATGRMLPSRLRITEER